MEALDPQSFNPLPVWFLTGYQRARPRLAANPAMANRVASRMIAHSERVGMGTGALLVLVIVQLPFSATATQPD